MPSSLPAVANCNCSLPAGTQLTGIPGLLGLTRIGIKPYTFLVSGTGAGPAAEEEGEDLAFGCPATAANKGLSWDRLGRMITLS